MEKLLIGWHTLLYLRIEALSNEPHRPGRIVGMRAPGQTFGTEEGSRGRVYTQLTLMATLAADT